jgi:hypothetical protein
VDPIIFLITPGQLRLIFKIYNPKYKMIITPRNSYQNKLKSLILINQIVNVENDKIKKRVKYNLFFMIYSNSN